MGRTFAIDLSDEVKNEQLSLEVAVTHHLRGNHYPPVPYSMVTPCIQAIDIIQRAQWGDADANELVHLPAGVNWKGNTSAPAYAIVESHHLSDFIEWDEYL